MASHRRRRDDSILILPFFAQSLVNVDKSVIWSGFASSKISRVTRAARVEVTFSLEFSILRSSLSADAKSYQGVALLGRRFKMNSEF